jgi:hypothetical protein
MIVTKYKAGRPNAIGTVRLPLDFRRSLCRHPPLKLALLCEKYELMNIAVYE